MSDFAGNEKLLHDFLAEAGELLAQVDNMLVELEKDSTNRELLNSIFRGFHTIKGGAGFLSATKLVALCHRTENLFDQLRKGTVVLSAELMDVILAATAEVRAMFNLLEHETMPPAAEAYLLAALEAAASGKPYSVSAQPLGDPAGQLSMPTEVVPENAQSTLAGEPDWALLYQALLGARAPQMPATVVGENDGHSVDAGRSSAGRRASDQPNGNFARVGRRDSDKVAVKETTIRVDTERLDQVLNLSGEIGLTKNRLVCLRVMIMHGNRDADTLHALDEAVSQLDLLVGNLQNAVMKTRMQPVARLFQKYPRMARDLARQLGKDVDLEIRGEDTELDRTMIDELADPLVHLVRNAVDHGIEDAGTRSGVGKPEKATVRLSAEQAGDRIILEVSDDGRGMRPEVIRNKALEKGLIDSETANSLDDKPSLQLIFLPGFSTKDNVSDVSGRGVGMDVVRTNIEKLNGRIEIVSVPGEGATISIALSLTLAILPVLVVRLAEQPFALPLAMVREMISINPEAVLPVNGHATMSLRDEVLPVLTLASLVDWPLAAVPRYGVLLESSTQNAFIRSSR